MATKTQNQREQEAKIMQDNQNSEIEFEEETEEDFLKTEPNIDFLNLNNSDIDSVTPVTDDDTGMILDNETKPEEESKIEYMPDTDSNILGNELDNDFEEAYSRGLSGRMPSMRPPRKNRLPLYNSYETSKSIPRNNSLPLPNNLLGREFIVPEIEIPGLKLKEDIEIELNTESILAILQQYLNYKYKKEGLEVNGEVKLNFDFKSDDEFVPITAKAKMKRIPIVKVREV